MGNTQSRILGSVYYLALSVSALITLVCLFGIPRAQVFLQVHAQAPAPTITLGTTASNMGTGSYIGDLYNAKLDSTGTVAVIGDRYNGPILTAAAPYAFLRRNTIGPTEICTFDGTEGSSASTAQIFCRRHTSAANYFYVFKFSDLSMIKDGSGNSPLVVSSSTFIAGTGFFQAIPGTSYAFLTSSNADSTLIRISTSSSSFTFTGVVSTTKIAQDTDNSGETYRWGGCVSNTYCYSLSDGKKLAKFSQGDSTTDPAFESFLDLNVANQLAGTSQSSIYNAVVIDSINNNLFCLSTLSGNTIVKIDLTSFLFVSRVVLSGSNSWVTFCYNCFTNGGSFLMVLGHGLYYARLVNTSGMMMELTDSGTYLQLSSKPLTGWLSQSENSGVIITDADQAISVTTTGVTTPAPTPAPPTTPVPPTPVPSTPVPPTTTSIQSPPTNTPQPSLTTASSTSSPTPPVGNNNLLEPSDNIGTSVIVAAAVGSVAGVAAVGGGIFLIYKKCWQKSSSSSAFGGNKDLPHAHADTIEVHH